MKLVLAANPILLIIDIWTYKLNTSISWTYLTIRQKPTLVVENMLKNMQKILTVIIRYWLLFVICYIDCYLIINIFFSQSISNTHQTMLFQHVSHVLFEGEKFSISWKLHILCVHIPQFLAKRDHGLAVYAEQTGEAAHAHMKPILRRWKVREEKPSHGDKLRRAAANYTRFNL